MHNHYHLKGKIFKRKAMSPSKLYGLTYFGIAATSYQLFPYMALHFGATLTTTGIAASLLAGMYNLNERNVVNSIEFVKDESSPYNGKLKFNVSTGPLYTSKDIYADVKECQAMLSLGNDDLGEKDVDGNVVSLRSHWENGQLIENGGELLTLPADAWKDENMLDWVLSIKNADSFSGSSLDAVFNECMLEDFNLKVESGGFSAIDVAVANSVK